jgi:hypothetical protein
MAVERQRISVVRCVTWGTHSSRIMAPSFSRSAKSRHFLQLQSSEFLQVRDALGARDERLNYPFHQANIILPTIPVPSFMIQVMVAERAEASTLPTPTPLSMACVVKIPVMVLQNAWTVSHS